VSHSENHFAPSARNSSQERLAVGIFDRPAAKNARARNVPAPEPAVAENDPRPPSWTTKPAETHPSRRNLSSLGSMASIARVNLKLNHSQTLVATNRVGWLGKSDVGYPRPRIWGARLPLRRPRLIIVMLQVLTLGLQVHVHCILMAPEPAASQVWAGPLCRNR